MDELEVYLMTLDDRLDVGARERSDVLCEIRAHLLAMIREEEANGPGESEAIPSILRRFGDAVEIANQINQAYREGQETIKIGPLLISICPSGFGLRQRVFRSVITTTSVTTFYWLLYSLFFFDPPARPSVPVTWVFVTLLMCSPFLLSRFCARLSSGKLISLANLSALILLITGLAGFALEIYSLNGTVASRGDSYSVAKSVIGYLGLFLVPPVLAVITTRAEIGALGTRQRFGQST